MNCPKCGTNNRSSAKFCIKCGAPLAPGMTMKVCPQCGQQNRMAAAFCTKCGHTFAKQRTLPVSRRVVYAAGAAIVALGVLITAALSIDGRRGKPTSTAAPTTVRVTVSPTHSPVPATITPSPTLAPTVTPSVPEALTRALLSTVQVVVPLEGQTRSSGGSGSVLTEKGHILTNFHVVGDRDTGQLYNQRGLIYVAVSPANLKDPPEIKYMAEVVQADRSMDLVLLKITATRNGGSLPVSLGLDTMPVGDSDTVKIGDELSIIGFPGLGGATVTFTKGSVSGFLSDEGWIKTDAEINPGNSGGAAINNAGQLVGIPSAATAATSRLPGKIGLVRPVNLARPLIERALKDAE